MASIGVYLRIDDQSASTAVQQALISVVGGEMNFQSDSLRTLDAESKKFAQGIRHHNRSPLILVRASGEVMTACDRGGKDSIVEAYDESSDLLLWAWAGEFRTDVFRLTRQDLKDCYLPEDDLKPKTIEGLRDKLNLK